MAAENPLWGQDRIAGELGKLGLEVSPRTVAKYLGDRSPGPRSAGRMDFLRAEDHHIWACDWLRVKTLAFRTLYVFVVFAHARRRVVHFHITDQPTDVGPPTNPAASAHVRSALVTRVLDRVCLKSLDGPWALVP